MRLFDGECARLVYNVCKDNGPPYRTAVSRCMGTRDKSSHDFTSTGIMCINAVLYRT